MSQPFANTPHPTHRTKPYFFAFNSKALQGRILADCARFETLNMAADGFDQTEFALFGADCDRDIRIRTAFESAFRFVLRNQTTDAARRLKAFLHQVRACCITEAWDEIDSDELCKLIQDLELTNK